MGGAHVGRIPIVGMDQRWCSRWGPNEAGFLRPKGGYALLERRSRNQLPEVPSRQELEMPVLKVLSLCTNYFVNIDQLSLLQSSRASDLKKPRSHRRLKQFRTVVSPNWRAIFIPSGERETRVNKFVPVLMGAEEASEDKFSASVGTRVPVCSAMLTTASGRTPARTSYRAAPIPIIARLISAGDTAPPSAGSLQIVHVKMQRECG